MSEESELLCVRTVGRNKTVTLPNDLKKYPSVAFEKEPSSGKIYARGIKKVCNEDE